MYIFGSVCYFCGLSGLEYRLVKVEACQLGRKLETDAISSYNGETVEDLHNESLY